MSGDADGLHLDNNADDESVDDALDGDFANDGVVCAACEKDDVFEGDDVDAVVVNVETFFLTGLLILRSLAISSEITPIVCMASYHFCLPMNHFVNMPATIAVVMQTIRLTSADATTSDNHLIDTPCVLSVCRNSHIQTYLPSQAIP